MKLNSLSKKWLRLRSISHLKDWADIDAMEKFDSGACYSRKNTALNQYPDQNATALKKEFARIHNILPEMVTVGNGADELIEIIPQLFINPGDKVVVIVPTFFRFIDSSIKRGADIIKIVTEEKNNFAINKNIAKTVINESNKHNAKLIWLCSPGNPTGNVIQNDLIQKIIKETKAFIVIDQVLQDFFDDDTSLFQFAKHEKKILVLKSMSKIHGLAGIRIGFGIAHPSVIKIIEKWRFPFNTSSLSQKLAIKILREDSHINHIRKKISKNREFVFAKIRKMPNFIIGGNSKTNIFLLKHRTKDLFEELIKKNILVSDFRTAQGIKGLGYVRITIQPNRKKNNLLLKALSAIS